MGYDDDDDDDDDDRDKPCAPLDACGVIIRHSLRIFRILDPIANRDPLKYIYMSLPFSLWEQWDADYHKGQRMAVS